MSDEGERFLRAISALIERSDGLVEIGGPEHVTREAGMQDYRVTSETKLGSPIIGTADSLADAAEAALEHLEKAEELEADDAEL